MTGDDALHDRIAFYLTGEAPMTTNTDAVELEPCRFCGHDGDGLEYCFPDALKYANFNKCQAYCLNCGTHGPISDEGVQGARKLWNTRAAVNAVMEWRDIESAPRDGTPVLIFSPDAIEPQIMLAQFVDIEMYDEPGEWFDFWDEQKGTPIDAAPTHWMPLPPPPKQRSE